MMSFSGVLSLFLSPVVLAGAFAAGVCWVAASRDPSASGPLSFLAKLGAVPMSIIALVVMVDAMHADTSSGIAVLILMLVPAAWAFTIYATFRITKIAKAYGDARAAGLLDDSTQEIEEFD